MNVISQKSRFYHLTRSILLWALNATFALVKIFVEGWRWWVGVAVAGATVCAAYGLLQPTLYRSEGTLTITPRYLLEGYMLATQELTHHYAARLTGDERIERAMMEAETEIEPKVEAESQPGMIITLTVEHPDPAVAEGFTRGLLLDLRNEILLENRTRIENDRLTVDLSLTSFARPGYPSWEWYAAVGTLSGFFLGTLWVYLMAFWRRGRLRSDKEIRQAVGLPTLGMIPRR
jgi:hypothetical protein